MPSLLAIKNVTNGFDVHGIGLKSHSPYYTSRMHVAHDRPNYKYLHVGIPHWPVSVSADCEYIGAQSLRRPNYTGQARCNDVCGRPASRSIRSAQIRHRSLSRIAAERPNRSESSPRPVPRYQSASCT